MRRHCVSVVALLLAALVLPASRRSSVPSPFRRQTMTGWRGFKKPDNSSRIVVNGLHVVYWLEVRK